MNIATYLQDYLESNNTKVIGYIPAFIELGIASINKTLRAAFLEVSGTNPSLPLGFVAMRNVKVNDITYTYSNDGTPYTFNIVSNALVTYPTLAVDDILEYTYYQVNESVLTSYSPNLLIHAAAYEAYLYIGDNDTANIELSIYQTQLADAKGWDSQGTITLGGK